MSLNDLILNKRLIVCCGSGGVGKTTTAAAIALKAAVSGRKTLVITIDPARRLAQSLGLEALSNTETAVAPERFEKAGLAVSGQLFAAMLDTKASFDALIERITSSPEQAKRILENPIYRQLSNAIAGSQEYVAMERLNEMMNERDFDLVVLDTPPTKNALDFLNAPNRLAAFLDDGIVKWFQKSSKSGMGSLLFQKGGEVVFKLLGLLVGDGFVRDLAEFFQAFSGLYSGFRERAERVNLLLRDPSTVFLLVTSVEQNALAEALYFHDRLIEAGIPLEAVVVNRAYEPTGETDIDPVALSDYLAGDTVRAALKNSADSTAGLSSLGRKLATTHNLAQRLNRIAEDNINRARRALKGAQRLALVPIFADDIHDIAGLDRMNAYLFNPVSS